MTLEGEIEYEPGVRSRCCKREVQRVMGLTAVGDAYISVCVSCGERCYTERVFDSLPPVGTFERPLKPRRGDGRPRMDL